jgi:hypothetical protein
MDFEILSQLTAPISAHVYKFALVESLERCGHD